MSNWIAAEFAKFKAWVQSHVDSSNSKLTALEQRVAALEEAAKHGAPTSSAS